jgi:redox-sensitive bicupin YhaK (pirin superfamily)
VPTSDGAGVRLTRLIGTPALSDIDPFLLLDQIRSDSRADYIAGFPEHPHRGFETVTVMLAGRMRHGDSLGHDGVIGPGGVQWMTAGRGIVHSERPEQEDGLLWGFQLWVNLPACAKLCPPRYQEFEADAIPVERRAGVTVRVIAGVTQVGTRGPAESAATDPLLLEVSLEPGAYFREALTAGHNAFVAVHAGGVRGHDVHGRPREVHDPELALLGEGTEVHLQAGGEGARLLLVAGRPLREPVVRHGPFVMNTEAEIRQAIVDYRAGRL